jgi:hypothetical protein
VEKYLDEECANNNVVTRQAIEFSGCMVNVGMVDFVYLQKSGRYKKALIS